MKMFSIEETLEEIINFVKKFFNTILFVFSSATILYIYGRVKKDESRLSGSLFLLICLVIMLGLQVIIVPNMFEESIHKIVEDYNGFFEAGEIENHVLLIIPIGLFAWMIITIVGKIFGYIDRSLASFTYYCFYWLGTSFLIMTILNIFYVTIGNLWVGDSDIEMLNLFAILRQIINGIIFCVPFLIQVFIIRKWLRKRRINFDLVYWVGPVTVGLIFYFTIPLSNFIGDIAELNEMPITVLSDNGSDFISISCQCGDNSCMNYKLTLKAIIINKSKSPIFIDLSKELLLLSQKEIEVKSQIEHVIHFKMKSPDVVSSNKIKILKPGDTFSMTADTSMKANEVKYYLGLCEKSKYKDYHSSYIELNPQHPESGMISNVNEINVQFALQDGEIVSGNTPTKAISRVSH